MNDVLKRPTASFFRCAFLCAALFAVPSVAWSADCAQPVSETGSPTIKDCIYIARSSISDLPCANCVCDANGSGDIRITDALRCLWFVVGGDGVTLDCPPCNDTSTTTLPGCASCNDALVGASDVEDLCESSRILYDDMKACPCEACPQECGPTPPLCASAERTITSAPSSYACIRCLVESCRPAITACFED